MADCKFSDMDFDCDGFHNIELTRTEDCVHLRTNVHSKEDFERWLEIYCKRTNTCFISKKLYPIGERKAFHQSLLCQHGNKRVTGKKKTFTG